MDPKQLFSGNNEIFRKEKIEFAVIGAFGLHAYGYTKNMVLKRYIMNSQENDKPNSILEFTWDKKEEEFSKREIRKSDVVASLEPYLDFLEEIGAFKGDRTLSKIYPEPFSLF